MDADGRTTPTAAPAYRTAWLEDGLLLAAGDLPILAAKAGSVDVRVDRPGDVDAVWLPLGKRRARAESRAGVMLLRLTTDVVGSLKAVEPSTFPLVGPSGGHDPRTDLRTLLREQLAGLDTSARQKVLRFVLEGALNEG